MRHRLVKPALAGAALTVVAAAGAGLGTAVTAAAGAQSGGHRAAAPAVVSSAAAAARSIFLITGNQLTVSFGTGPRCVGSFSQGPRSLATGPLQTLQVAGATYAWPAAAVPYLGRGLGLSLFDLKAVTAAESDGRLPVRVRYTGARPSLPGVTIIGSGRGTARGYLTQAGAKRFGSALARGPAAGPDGVFGGRVLLALGGSAPAGPRPAAGKDTPGKNTAGKNTPAKDTAAKDTVRITGTGISGQPAGPESAAFLYNADDSAKFDNFYTSVQPFSHGAATFHVPPGHYWAIGDFFRRLPKEQSWDTYLDVLPQFTVGGDTTVHVAASAATSEIEAVVPRPAVVQETVFQFIRSAAAGPAVTAEWIESNAGPKSPAATVYVSPTSASPSVGKLASVTFEQLGPAAAPRNNGYLYDLAYQSGGTIPDQRHVVDQASLATLHQQYFSDVASAGLLTMWPQFPVDYDVCPFPATEAAPTRVPLRLTDYASASPALSWQPGYVQSESDASGGQLGSPQTFTPGEQLTQDFGAYPLHPAPSARLGDIAGLPPVPVSASRAGNTLRLDLSAFSDSVPGHAGAGENPPVKAAASYQIDQNGTKIAGGAVPGFWGPITAAATLSPSASVIRFALDTSESPTLGPLPTATQTVWTWRSAPRAGATLPPGWTCLLDGAADRACAVQPMMTLRYDVAGMGRAGSTHPGQQTVHVLAGHIEPGLGAKITRLSVSVSFDGGQSWQQARVTGGDGSYTTVFKAAAGARVTLRTRAADAAGGSVTETIDSAYQVAS